MPSVGDRNYAQRFHSKAFALDCEMVGGKGDKDLLGRVSIVSEDGEIMLDEYVKPTEPVEDYRTRFSGIRPENLVNAKEIYDVEKRVERILNGSLLVGHSLINDLKVLNISHPPKMIYDTQKCPLIIRFLGLRGRASLKHLAEKILTRNVQNGEHDSVEDARTTMDIYQFMKEYYISGKYGAKF